MKGFQVVGCVAAFVAVTGLRARPSRRSNHEAARPIPISNEGSRYNLGRVLARSTCRRSG